METISPAVGDRIPQFPLRAILVEDRQIIHDTLVPALAELANTEVVSWATTAEQAKLAVAKWHGRWQLIIVDLFLETGSGLEVLSHVRDRDPTQIAFVLSNYATAEMRRRCKELGADDIFDKSTEIDSFLERCIAIARSA